MQFLKGCNKVTLTHLVDAYSEKFLDEKWHSGISLSKIQAHDFNDVFSRTEIKSKKQRLRKPDNQQKTC